MPEQPPPKPPRRPGSKPDLQGIITPDQPERAAVKHHPGVDGAVQPVPRKLTAPGGFSIPQPDLLKTERAPRLDAPTVRATPVSGTPAQRPDEDDHEALRRRLDAAERERDELRRQARVRAESDSPAGSFPPPVKRSPSPVPSSSPDAKLERAVGGTVVLLAKRFGWPAIAVALGIAGVAKPAADPGAVQASKENTEALRAEMSVMHEQLTSALKWMAAQSVYTQCIEENLDDVGEQVLPAQDKLANPTPLRAYIKRCRRLRP
jgi:hypothetical protein